jgi:hypothetical protein
MLIHAIVDATCRALRGLEGALVMARWARRHPRVTTKAGAAKDVYAVFRLMASPHAKGITTQQAIAVVRKARSYRVDPFDLWVTFITADCDDLDHAVTRVLELHAFYASDDKSEMN